MQRRKGLEIPPHARKRYRQWIDPAATDDQIREALQEALRGGVRLFSQPDYRAHYAVHGGAYRLVVRHAPGHAPAVITVLPGVGNPMVPDEDPYDRISDAPQETKAPTPPAAQAQDAKRVEEEEQRGARDAWREEMERKYRVQLAGSQTHAKRENLAKVHAWRLLLDVYPYLEEERQAAVRTAIDPHWFVTEGLPIEVPRLRVRFVSRFLRDNTVVETVRHEIRLYHGLDVLRLLAVGVSFETSAGCLAEDLLGQLDAGIAGLKVDRSWRDMHLLPLLHAARVVAAEWPDAIVRVDTTR